MDMEEFQENLEPVKEFLGKHKVLLIFIVLAAAAYYAYFYVIPRPGTLTVSVSELDGGPLEDAEVTVIDSDGKTLGTELTSGGIASFANMPSRKTLKIQVSKGIAFRPGGTTAEIPSGESASAEVPLERKNSLSFVGNGIPSAIPAGCADEFQVEVANSGSDNFDAELVAEEEAAEVLSVVSPKQTVFFNSSTNFAVKINSDAKIDESGQAAVKKGSLRIKKTLRKLPLSLKIIQKLNVEAAPADISIRTAELQKTRLTFTNRGEQPVTGVQLKLNGDADLKQACGQDLQSCIAIENLGSVSSEIPPSGGQLTFSLVITPPNQPGKPFLGSIELTANCLRKSPVLVPIIIEVPVTS